MVVNQQDKKNHLKFIRETIMEVGKTAGKYFKSEYEVTMKGVDNPLTTADLEVNDQIHARILAEYGSDGWLSEETADSEERLQKSRCWIVDPIDGTKEFVKGIPEFAVSIALCVDGVALIGAIYNPIQNHLFYGAVGVGCFDIQDNQVYIPATPKVASPEVRLVASRTESSKGMFESIAKKYQVIQVGSVAYKLGLVAGGLADFNISYQPKNEWDVAGGIALVHASGGECYDLAGERYKFNQKDPLNMGLVAGNAALVDDFFSHHK